MRKTVLVLVLGFLGLAAPAAADEPPMGAPAPSAVDVGTKEAARQVAAEGFALYDKGDCAGALAKFTRAHELVRASTLALHAGKCLQKLGRLVEASDWFRVALADPPDVGAAAVQAKAQQEAAALRAALQPRIPHVVFVLDRPTPDAQVYLDGQLLPPAAVGLLRPIDPGVHHAEVRRGADRIPREFAVDEGERGQLTLKTTPQSPEDLVNPYHPTPLGPDRTGVGPGPWIVGGVGAAGILVGIVAGIVTVQKKSDNDAGCNPTTRTCTQAGKDAAAAGRTAGAVTTVGLVVGGAGLAAAGLWAGLGSKKQVQVGVQGTRFAVQGSW